MIDDTNQADFALIDPNCSTELGKPFSQRKTARRLALPSWPVVKVCLLR